MKGKALAICILVALGFVLVGVFFTVLPDRVPAHYNVRGEIDRYGSKYEYLILPGFGLMMGAAFLLLGRLYRKKGDPRIQNISLLGGIFVVALFDAMSLFFLCKAAANARLLPSAVAEVDAMKVLAMGLGALCIALGAVMPNVRRINGVFGLRTKWSVKNQRTWDDCQRFGGIASFGAGLLMILCGIFLGGASVLVALLVIAIALGVVSAVASRRIYEKNKG